MTDKSRASTYSLPLNGYRGVCALLVFGFHLGVSHVVEPERFGHAVDFLWRSLCLGVEMFFMISGYVILGSLQRHTTIGGFLRDRVIRIYSAWTPALFAVTVVCVVLRMKSFEGVSSGTEALGVFVANLLLLPPILPLPLIHWVSWSLSFEWLFYLAAASGMALLRWRHAPGARLQLAQAFWIVAGTVMIAYCPRALFFLPGVLVLRHRAWFESRTSWLRWPLLSSLIFMIAWHATGYSVGAVTVNPLSWLGGDRWLLALVAFAAGLHMFASVVTGASRQFRFLEGEAFQFMGQISYSFYLWHMVVIAFVKRPVISQVVPRFGQGIGFVLFALTSLALSLLVSWASYQVFEVRLAGAWRRGWRSSPNPAALPKQAELEPLS
jgi:peptidoglycan/LPS O-acetylase OafA/YrhL